MLRDILIQRLIERSTWVGITLVAGALGAGHNPDRIDSIATAVAIVVGLLAMFWPDRDPCRGIRQRGHGAAEDAPDKHVSGYFRWTQGTRKEDREKRKREKREDFEAREEYRERKKKRRKRDHLS